MCCLSRGSRHVPEWEKKGGKEEGMIRDTGLHSFPAEPSVRRDQSCPSFPDRDNASLAEMKGETKDQKKKERANEVGILWNATPPLLVEVEDVPHMVAILRELKS